MSKRNEIRAAIESVRLVGTRRRAPMGLVRVDSASPRQSGERERMYIVVDATSDRFLGAYRASTVRTWVVVS